MNFEICFVSNSPLSANSQAKLSAFCKKCIQRENIGLDFSMWKTGLPIPATNMNRAYFVLVITCLALPMTALGDVLNLPPDVKSFLQTQDVMDDGYRSIPPTPEGHAFRSYMASNWQAVLDNIQSVAPNPKAQRLIVSALDDLPARTYLKALDKLCDLQTHGAISSEMLAYAFKGHRRSLLSKNYQDPDVIDLAHRVQTQLPKNA